MTAMATPQDTSSTLDGVDTFYFIYCFFWSPSYSLTLSISLRRWAQNSSSIIVAHHPNHPAIIVRLHSPFHSDPILYTVAIVLMIIIIIIKDNERNSCSL